VALRNKKQLFTKIFSKGGNKMTAEETLDLVAKQWCTLEDIMKLGHLGRN